MNFQRAGRVSTRLWSSTWPISKVSSSSFLIKLFYRRNIYHCAFVFRSANGDEILAGALRTSAPAAGRRTGHTEQTLPDAQLHGGDPAPMQRRGRPNDAVHKRSSNHFKAFTIPIASMNVFLFFFDLFVLYDFLFIFFLFFHFF